MTSCFVLAFVLTFGDQAPAPSVEFDSVVELLPERPDCAADDPRTATWLLANVLALRIDNRGHRLSRPDIHQDVAARLRMENWKDAKAMFAALELIREMESEPQPLFVGQ